MAATAELDTLFGVDIETGNKIVSLLLQRRDDLDEGFEWGILLTISVPFDGWTRCHTSHRLVHAWL